MNRFAVIPMIGLLAFAGCAALQRDSAQVTENNLAAAGFTPLPLSSPARQKMASGLPPNHISQRFEGERVSYLYPDPILCNCLYIGGQAAWGRYQAAAQARQIAADSYQPIIMDPGYGWDWGPWGGYGPGFY